MIHIAIIRFSSVYCEPPAVGLHHLRGPIAKKRPYRKMDNGVCTVSSHVCYWLRTSFQ